MSSKIDSARQEGYSDDEILDYLLSKDSSMKKKSEEAIKEGYSSTDIIKFIQEQKKPSKIRSLINAPIKGLVKGGRQLNPLQPQAYSPRKEILEKIFPTREEHEPLVTAGELAPIIATGPESIPLKLLQLAGGVTGKELARQADVGEFGQTLAEAGGMSIPGLVKAGSKAAIEGGKALFKGAKEKFPSGLTKLRATEASKPFLGSLSKERKQKVIKDLGDEASKLIREKSIKKLPKIEQLEKGFDFTQKYNKDFGALNKSVEKFNPELEIDPIFNFLRESKKQYRGIDLSLLPPEDKKILSLAKSFENKPVSDIKRLLKIYRLNNKRRREISETSLFKGKQRDFVNFLSNFNDAIAETFETNLPKDSGWLKIFKESNADYKNYIDSLNTMKNLKGFLSTKPSTSEINRIATNEISQKKLIKQIGEKEGKEIISVAKDLKDSIESIKKIPSSQFSKFDSFFPVLFLLPFLGKLVGLTKGVKGAKYGYGYFLSTASRRNNYKNAVKSLVKNDLEGYKKAVKPFMDELTEDSFFESKQD